MNASLVLDQCVAFCLMIPRFLSAAYQIIPQPDKPFAVNRYRKQNEPFERLWDNSHKIIFLNVAHYFLKPHLRQNTTNTVFISAYRRRVLILEFRRSHTEMAV